MPTNSSLIKSVYYYAAAHPEESWDSLAKKFASTKVFDFSTGKVVQVIPRTVWLARACVFYWLEHDLPALHNPRFDRPKTTEQSGGP